MNVQNSIRVQGEQAAEPEHIEDIVVERVEPRKVANLLLWLILAFFVIFVVWAALSKIDRSVHAVGRIIPDSRLQVISNLEGGIVKDILVEAGDKVKAGDPLIRLDQTQSQADFGSNAVTASSLQAKIARLQAQITGRSPNYPSLDAARTWPMPSPSSSRFIHRRSLNFPAWKRPARPASPRRIAAVSEAEANYQLRPGAGAQLSAAGRHDASAGRTRHRAARDADDARKPGDVARSQAQAQQATIARMQAQVAESQSSLAQARQDWRSRSAAELADAQAKLAALRSTLPALRDRVDRSVISAPVAGEVNRVLVSTIGGSVGPGQPLVELVPSGDSLMIEGRLNTKDIGFVRIGQPARINITAFDSGIYGSLDGEVVSISPDATVDERTGESFYMVHVRTKGTLKDSNGKTLRLAPA